MPSVVSNSISLLGGAAVGALAMFLLDPDLGEDRRREVADTANDAVASTAGAVRSTVKSTVRGSSDSAHSVANTIGRYAKGLAGTVSGQVSDRADDLSDAADSAVGAMKSANVKTRKAAGDALESATRFGRGLFKKVKAKQDDLTDAASDAVNSASSYGSGLFSKGKAKQDDLFDSASSLVGRAKSSGWAAVKRATPEESHPVATTTGITAGSIAVLALGAGLMYYLDPERGRSRRALARDKIYSTTRRSGDKMRRYGHHLGNKAHGYAAEARRVMPAQWVDATQSGTSDHSASDLPSMPSAT